MLSKFIQEKLDKAKYRLLKDKTYFATITGLEGVWGQGKTMAACKQELREVLEDWIILKLQDRDHIPGLTTPKRKRATKKQPPYAKARVLA